MRYFVLRTKRRPVLTTNISYLGDRHLERVRIGYGQSNYLNGRMFSYWVDVVGIARHTISISNVENPHAWGDGASLQSKEHPRG